MGTFRRTPAYEIIQKFLFEENRDLVGDWMIGNVNSEEVVLRIAKQTKLDPSFLYFELKKSCRAMDFVSPEILGLVSEIRSNGSFVAIATDNMDTFTRWTVPARNLKNYFDGILNSYDLGISKRKGEPFFGIFLDEYGIDPRYCIMIDDSEDRNGVLASYGFKYLKIERGVGLVSELKKILYDL